MATEMTRHARLELKYRGKDIGGYCTNADYTDHGHGQLDEICARLEDRDFNWQGPWIPSKGDSIEAIIHCHNWFVSGDHLKLTCGKFEIQEVSLRGRPGLSQPWPHPVTTP